MLRPFLSPVGRGRSEHSLTRGNLSPFRRTTGDTAPAHSDVLHFSKEALESGDLGLNLGSVSY